MRDWVATTAERNPDRTAVIDADQDESVTYLELSDRIDRIAGQLLTAGVSAGDRVGLLLHRSPAMIATFWATIRVGTTAVLLDATETPESLSRASSRAEITHLVVQPETAAGIVEAVPTSSVLSIGALDQESVTPLDSLVSRSFVSEDLDLDRTRLILFTSGTTGDPRGVRLTLRNVAASAAGSAFRLGVDPTDRWLLTLPTYHMGGLSIPIRTAMYGTTTVLEREFDAQSTAETIEAHDVTGVSLVPTMLRRLLEESWTPTSLRFALVGGAPTPPDLATRAIESGIPIYPTYGMTETASQVATATPGDVRYDSSTVGRPIRTATVRIGESGGSISHRSGGVSTTESGPASSDRGPNVSSVAIDAGPILVSGPIVSDGYLEDEESRTATPEGGKSDPGNGGDAGANPLDRESGTVESTDRDWFRTGDLGYIDEDGRLFVVGRETDHILTGGETVVPAEVERAIRDHQAVESVAVVGIDDPEWGQRVSAMVVPGAPISRSALQTFLEDRLAGYKIPKTILFAESIPRTQSGTVDREAVQALLREETATD
ncbi:MAG: AMP-binding protein [Halodesulfurarchaeum sp.]